MRTTPRALTFGSRVSSRFYGRARGDKGVTERLFKALGERVAAIGRGAKPEGGCADGPEVGVEAAAKASPPCGRKGRP